MTKDKKSEWKDSTVLLDVKVDCQKCYDSLSEEQKKKWEARREYLNSIIKKEIIGGVVTYISDPVILDE